MAESNEAQRYAEAWEELSRLERRMALGMGSALGIWVLALVLGFLGLDLVRYLAWLIFAAAAIGVTSNIQLASARCPRCDRFFLRARSDPEKCANCGLERDAPPPEGR
ncbi:hypothetical protein FGE12_25830 [Aggregicoccus sp. 17bor-14]|uniref:hypothetical protein n=1 Tax=Myxococcaceae TaxID=31 RepID=UPI00129D1A9C|nr:MULTISPECIES: hypothetical protein [Myxococcaceae]MBF5045856.1 hypothetical protein [Simulacricoccus sp. 17bor-14]MRI91590.1 hypothetical protein [Aggregicoccus sp. 17bor-14]